MSKKSKFGMTPAERALEAARDGVRAETFRTDAWEAKMTVVRDLCQKAADAAPRFAYTSIDGDIFAPRPGA